MPLPPVVIELSAADAASPHAAALVAACSQSVADGECRLGSSKGGAEPRAVAIVSWPEGKTSHIQLGVRRRGEVRWVERDLRFSAEDPDNERWRSVGLVIGTLVGEAEAEARAEQARAPKPLPPPAAPRQKPRSAPRAQAEPEPPRVWIGLDALSGPALDDGSWRFGGGLLGRYRPPIAPLAATATLRYAFRPEQHDVFVDWLDLAGGVGALLTPAESLGVFAGLSLSVERIHASASVAEQTDSGSRWLGGARASGEAVWSPVPPWGFAIGAELGWRSGETAIRVANRDVGSAPTLTYVVTLGVRAALF